jgi:hypothetical protein
MDLLNAQNTAPVFKIKIFEDRGYYGIIDSSGNKLIKALKYDEVLDFSYGLARVVKDNVLLLLDKKGTIIKKYANQIN